MTSLYPRSKTWSITCQKMLKNIKVSPEAQDDVLGWLRGVKKKGNSHFTEADPVWYLITNQWTVAVLPDLPVLLYEHNCRYKTSSMLIHGAHQSASREICKNKPASCFSACCSNSFVWLDRNGIITRSSITNRTSGEKKSILRSSEVFLPWILYYWHH